MAYICVECKDEYKLEVEPWQICGACEICGNLRGDWEHRVFVKWCPEIVRPVGVDDGDPKKYIQDQLKKLAH